MAYDIKFRERILSYIDKGHTLEDAHKVFGVGTATIKRWRKLHKETGSLQDAPKEKWHKRLTPLSS